MAGEEQANAAANGRVTVLGVELPVTADWCMENLGVSFREIVTTGYGGYQSQPHWEVTYVEPDGRKLHVMEFKREIAQMFLRMVELAKRRGDKSV